MTDIRIRRIMIPKNKEIRFETTTKCNYKNLLGNNGLFSQMVKAQGFSTVIEA